MHDRTPLLLLSLLTDAQPSSVRVVEWLRGFLHPEVFVQLLVFVVTAVGIGVALYALRQTGLATRASVEAAQTAREQLRLSTTPSVYVDGLDVENFEEGALPVFLLRIGNSSDASAHNVEIFSKIEYSGGSSEPGGGRPDVILVPARSVVPYDIASNVILPTRDKIAALQMRVVGYVKLGDERTDFCFKQREFGKGEPPKGFRRFVPCHFDTTRVVAVAVALTGVEARAMAGSVTARIEENLPSNRTD